MLEDNPTIKDGKREMNELNQMILNLLFQKGNVD